MDSKPRKIAEAKAALEAEARQKTEQKKAQAKARIAEREQQAQEAGKKAGGRLRHTQPSEVGSIRTWISGLRRMKGAQQPRKAP